MKFCSVPNLIPVAQTQVKGCDKHNKRNQNSIRVSCRKSCLIFLSVSLMIGVFPVGKRDQECSEFLKHWYSVFKIVFYRFRCFLTFLFNNYKVTFGKVISTTYQQSRK